MPKPNKLPQGEQQRKALLAKLEEQISKMTQAGVRCEENEAKVQVLKQRTKLITSIRDYNEARLKNLEKILKHYSTHVFKPGQKYDFDEISYINEHMIMERFFAFLIDFKLNQIQVNGQRKQLVDSKEIVLLFKKCSSNSKDLDLAEFIACLERFFVMVFDENEGFAKKQKRLELQKIRNRLQAKRRQFIAVQKQKARMAADIKLREEAKKPASLDAKAKKQKQKQKQKQKAERAKQQKIEAELQSILKQLDQISKPEVKNLENQQIYSITEEQKIESYMLRMGIDDKKQIQKKLRYFEKANYRYTEVQELQKFKPQTQTKKQQNLPKQRDPKKELVSMHEEWSKQKSQLQKSKTDRFNDVRSKLSQRQLEKSKLHLLRSLSKEEYQNKSIKMSERYHIRQKSRLDNKNLIKKKQQSQESFYSLEMLHRSSPNDLRVNKIVADKYLSPDPTDRIFLDQYGFLQQNTKKSQIDSNASMIQSTKRRAVELQTQQSKKLSRLAKNLTQNQHYLQKFLQRKW